MDDWTRWRQRRGGWTGQVMTIQASGISYLKASVPIASLPQGSSKSLLDELLER